MIGPQGKAQWNIVQGIISDDKCLMVMSKRWLWSQVCLWNEKLSLYLEAYERTKSIDTSSKVTDNQINYYKCK